MLTSARRQYTQQAQIVRLGVANARRLERRGVAAVAQSIRSYQAAAVWLAIESAVDVLTEQGIDPSQEATASAGALLTGSRVADLLSKVENPGAFERLVASLIVDAGRSAASVDMVTRPAVTGYIRSLSPPSCSRCAILAGRIYRHSQGFLRHPLCDCLMTPTDDVAGLDLVTDPMDAFERGWISDLSKADTEAIRLGADMAQVVNVRKQRAGLRVGSSVYSRRGGKPTPAAILAVSSGRMEALALLRRWGYLTS